MTSADSRPFILTSRRTPGNAHSWIVVGTPTGDWDLEITVPRDPRGIRGGHWKSHQNSLLLIS